MSYFTRFNTIKIKIPEEMTYVSPRGKLKVVPSLTNKGNISKRLKEPSVILVKGNVDKPEIMNTGLRITKEEEKKQTIRKSKLLESGEKKIRARAGATINRRVKQYTDGKQQKKLELENQLKQYKHDYDVGDVADDIAKSLTGKRRPIRGQLSPIENYNKYNEVKEKLELLTNKKYPVILNPQESKKNLIKYMKKRGYDKPLMKDDDTTQKPFLVERKKIKSPLVDLMGDGKQQKKGREETVDDIEKANPTWGLDLVYEKYYQKKFQNIYEDVLKVIPKLKKLHKSYTPPPNDNYKHILNEIKNIGKPFYDREADIRKEIEEMYKKLKKNPNISQKDYQKIKYILENKVLDVNPTRVLGYYESMIGAASTR